MNWYAKHKKEAEPETSAVEMRQMGYSEKEIAEMDL
jgi:hypothetical protein